MRFVRGEIGSVQPIVLPVYAYVRQQTDSEERATQNEFIRVNEGCNVCTAAMRKMESRAKDNCQNQANASFGKLQAALEEVRNDGILRKYDISERGNPMKTIQRLALGTVVAVMLLGLGGCSGMSKQDKSTAIGAGVGAVGGAVLTGGSAIGTVGGAAVGGVIGHEIGDDD